VHGKVGAGGRRPPRLRRRCCPRRLRRRCRPCHLRRLRRRCRIRRCSRIRRRGRIRRRSRTRRRGRIRRRRSCVHGSPTGVRRQPQETHHDNDRRRRHIICVHCESAGAKQRNSDGDDARTHVATDSYHSKQIQTLLLL